MIKVTQTDKDSIYYLIRNLRDIDKDKSIRKGLGDAGNTFKSGGKRRLRQAMRKPNGVTGNLLRSFTVRVKKRKPGVLVGFSGGKNGGNHSHLVDSGTADRYWKTRGRKYVGKMTATRFWADTESQDAPAAMDKLYAGIEKSVYRIKNKQ